MGTQTRSDDGPRPGRISMPEAADLNAFAGNRKSCHATDRENRS